MSLINQKGRLQSGLFRQILAVKRLIGEHSTQGFHASYGEPEKVLMIAMPTNPKDVQLLPESERFFPSMKFYSETPLNIGDLVQFRDHDYRIISTSDWGDYGYYNNIGIRHSPTAKIDSAGFTVT